MPFTDPAPQTEFDDSGPAVHSVGIKEPIRVAVGAYSSARELSLMLRQVKTVPGAGLTLVIALSDAVRPADVATLAGNFQPIRRLVLTEERNCPQDCLTADALSRIAVAIGTKAVFYEPDCWHAVVAAMQHLNAGDDFLVAWPASLHVPLGLIRLGAKWRSALEQPDEGVYFPLPIEHASTAPSLPPFSPPERILW